MHTGKAPYRGATAAVLRQLAEGPPPRIAAIGAPPAWLDELVFRLHAPPAGRPYPVGRRSGEPAAAAVPDAASL